MSNLLRRSTDCNNPLGNRDTFCPRCGTRQPREPKSRACLALCVVMCLCAAGVHTAHSGANYPAKPVRVIVTFAPGGGTDLMVRNSGHKLADADTMQGMLSDGAQAQPSTPDGLDRFMGEESAPARKVIASAGIKSEQ